MNRDKRVDPRLFGSLPYLNEKTFNKARFEDLMRKARVSYADIARITGYHPSAISRMFTLGRFNRTIPLSLIPELVRILNVSEAELLQVLGVHPEILIRRGVTFPPRKVLIEGEITDDCRLTPVSHMAGRMLEVPNIVVSENARAFLVPETISKQPLASFGGQYGLTEPLQRVMLDCLSLVSLEGQPMVILGMLTHIEQDIVTLRTLNMTVVQGRQVLRQAQVINMGFWPLVKEEKEPDDDRIPMQELPQ